MELLPHDNLFRISELAWLVEGFRINDFVACSEDGKGSPATTE